MTEIAKKDKDSGVRKMAVSKISYRPSLTQIANIDSDPEVRKLATERLRLLD